ncbi:hypothetical protein [Gracilibacillus kekensis]|uniref:Flagellar protein FliT n=1 Tax=Gracilibacillus kekensis TaxID=1027249 RepID=A0A1M7MXV5_9BACI|nr:hypothetical protein [Gracilibacillus kekensis]SHM96020.1 flagellar protein FliT [Gracilibacillus kekensis]
MDAIGKYIEKTEKMIKLLEKPLKNEQREKAIETINQLIEEREIITKQIKGPFSTSEQELGKEALVLDQQLSNSMEQVYQHLKKDIRNAKKQPRSNNSYLNPYKNVASFDGRFLDSKK